MIDAQSILVPSSFLYFLPPKANESEKPEMSGVSAIRVMNPDLEQPDLLISNLVFRGETNRLIRTSLGQELLSPIFQTAQCSKWGYNSKSLWEGIIFAVVLCQ